MYQDGRWYTWNPARDMLRKWRKNTNLFATTIIIIIYKNYQKIVRWWDGGPCLSKKLCLLFFLLTNFLEQVFWRAPLSFLDAYMVSSSYHRSVKKKIFNLIWYSLQYLIPKKRSHSNGHQYSRKKLIRMRGMKKEKVPKRECSMKRGLLFPISSQV